MRSAIGVVGVLLLVLTACGSPPAAGTSPPTAPATSGTVPDTGSATASVPAGGTPVAIANFAFAPGTLTVKAGATVVWTNQDSDPHTVTSKDSAGPLKSPVMKKGDSYRFTFSTAG